MHYQTTIYTYKNQQLKEESSKETHTTMKQKKSNLMNQATDLRNPWKQPSSQDDTYY